jgi:hypothetical protein
MLCFLQNVLNGCHLKNLKNITYLTRGDFSNIYSADWPESNIRCWDIEKQEWERYPDGKFVLKSLDSLSNVSNDFLNELGI